jgi:hypothetical protein
MDERQKPKIRRRDLLIAVTATGVASAMGAKAVSSAATAGRRNKRKAQYQANSPEVQNFYRVNRYPMKG